MNMDSAEEKEKEVGAVLLLVLLRVSVMPADANTFSHSNFASTEAAETANVLGSPPVEPTKSNRCR